MSNYKVTRTFHPVGQGAFYSERHNDFNIVYDCGTTAYAKARPVVKSAFLYQDIDVLFISHFDNDHISTIEALRDSTNNIHTVVMPLLEPEHKNLLINLSSALSTGTLSLIKDPQAFFGSNTAIVRVRSTQESDREEDDDPLNLPTLPELSQNGLVQPTNPASIIVNSGRPLIINNESRWVFVPYNFKFEDRHTKLIKQLESLGFDVRELVKNPNYVMNSLKDSKSRKTLKNIYDKKLGGDINENSMLLYSGPSKDSESSDIYHCELIDHDSVYSCECFNSAGCIYTGDSDLNQVLKEDDIYLDYRRSVGIIQIPHHGSKENFNIKFFEQFYPVICPVSYGTKNSHGHPAAEVINELSMNQFRPILVNEQPGSKFVQEIEFNWLN